MQNKGFQDILDKYFIEDKENKKKIFDKLSLFIYQTESKDNDLYVLADMLETEDLLKLVSYFGGATLKIPTNE